MGPPLTLDAWNYASTWNWSLNRLFYWSSRCYSLLWSNWSGLRCNSCLWSNWCCFWSNWSSLRCNSCLWSNWGGFRCSNSLLNSRLRLLYHLLHRRSSISIAGAACKNCCYCECSNSGKKSNALHKILLVMRFLDETWYRYTLYGSYFQHGK